MFNNYLTRFSYIILLILSCSKSNSYSDYKIGSSLTMEVLHKSIQIIPFDNGTLLLSSILPNEGMFERHLLHYDSQNKLLSITYFPCRKVKEINATKIIGEKFDNAHRKEKYRNDEILNHQIILMERSVQSIGKMSNKIITNVEFNDSLLTLYTQESSDKNAGFSVKPTKIYRSENNKFGKSDTISILFKDAIFRYKSGIISTYKTIGNQELVSDEMVVNNFELLDSLYESILIKHPCSSQY